MLPQLRAQPGARHRRCAPLHAFHQRGFAKYIGGMVQHPAIGAVHLRAVTRPGTAVVIDKIPERFRGFRKVAHLGRPVVHLDVDVGMIIRIPGCGVLLIPDTLQVCRQAARLPGRTQEQVAPELKIQRHQAIIHLIVFDSFQPFVCRF